MNYLAKDFNIGLRIVPKVKEAEKKQKRGKDQYSIAKQTYFILSHHALGKKRLMDYFIMGISASGQTRPTMDASVKPANVLSNKNHTNSAAPNNM